jgi:TonB family protein
MKRAVVAIALAGACGGKPPPPPAPLPAAPAPVKRIPIEDSTEPDDGVSVVSTHGHMEPEVVQAGIAPHTDELAACFTTRAGRRRWLGGHVVVHWDIKADGEVTKVVLSESDLGAWPVEKCVLEIARAASFGKPVGGNAEFVLPLDFKALSQSNVWDEDRGHKAIGKQLDALAKCAKKQAPPDDVTITLYIGPHGVTQSVGFSSAKTVIDDVWGDCAEKAIMAWRLPDPHGMVAKLAVRYRPR